MFIVEPENDDTITGTVSGRNLVANFGKDSIGRITFAFKTITPHRMGTYTIPVSSSLHALPDQDAEVVTKSDSYKDCHWCGRRRHGRITLSRGQTERSTFSHSKILQTRLWDDPPYQGKYIAISKDEFRNLVIRFTAPGTMPGNSTVTLTAVGFPRFNVASDVIVSGNADKTFSPEGLMVIATIKPSGLQKGNTITFSIKTFDAPEVNPADNPASGCY